MDIFVKTPKYELKIECLYDFIEASKVVVEKDLFENMCKDGCPNYNKKYSCPPCSLKFDAKKKYLFVVLLRMNLEQLNEIEYMKLKIGNAVLKPRVERIMRGLEEKFGGKFFSTGSCRLCKKCGKAIGEKCRHPEKMRFSLESLGVDCNKLVEDVFGFELLWYKNNEAPEYTSVVCALPVDDKLNTKHFLEFLRRFPEWFES